MNSFALLPIMALIAFVPPEQIAQRKAEVLAKAEAICTTHSIGPTNRLYLPCINLALGKGGLEAEGTMAIHAKDGSIVLVDDHSFSCYRYRSCWMLRHFGDP